MPLVDSARLVLRPRTNSEERGSEQKHIGYTGIIVNLLVGVFHGSALVQATALTNQFHCL